MKPDGNTDKRGQDMGPNFREILPTLVQSDVRFILIQLKRAAGRPKDLEAIGELQAILEERQRATGGGL